MKKSMYTGGKKWAGKSSFQSAFGEGEVCNAYCSITNSVRVHLHAVSDSETVIYSEFNISIRLQSMFFNLAVFSEHYKIRAV